MKGPDRPQRGTSNVGPLPAGYRTEDVDFIPERQLVTWLAALDNAAVTKVAARDLIARLEEYRAGKVGFKQPPGLA